MSFYIFAVIRIFIDCKRSVFFYQHQIILLKIVILMLICLFVGFVLFVFDITWGEKYQWIKTWGKMDNDIFFIVFVY